MRTDQPVRRFRRDWDRSSLLRRSAFAVAIVNAAVLNGVVPATVRADPCGMVAPVAPLTLADGKAPIERVGAQITYVFYKDGIESFVIRPGFSGRVADFGMLIPFPTPPAIRKVPDEIFGQIAAAIDPPEVVVELSNRPIAGASGGLGGFGGGGFGGGLKLRLGADEVQVIREEAVGMYEVAVLAAGSAAALSKWMNEHHYRYPAGMDDACNDYIQAGWCFVAVRTRVRRKQGVDPAPGQRRVDATLPAEMSFDGHVQAMGFRFHSEKLVVPMRLSAFNAGRLRNIVYLLAPHPMRINSLSKDFVMRQLDGATLHRNLTKPLPLRIIGGKFSDIPRWRRKTLSDERDPTAHNGLAADLFAGDLHAARMKRLHHRFEELEKQLLEVSQRLRLQGDAIDRIHRETVRRQRETALGDALAEIRPMTLTVIDGDFPREIMAGENLTFRPFQMAAEKNTRLHYDTSSGGPGEKRPGSVILGLQHSRDVGNPWHAVDSDRSWALAQSDFTLPPESDRTPNGRILICGCAGLSLVWAWRRKHWKAAITGGVLLATASLIVCIAWADDQTVRRMQRELLRQLGDPRKAHEAADKLVSAGADAVEPLNETAGSGRQFFKRGWAIICLGRIGGPDAKVALTQIMENRRQPELIRTWAAAARVMTAATIDELISLMDDSGLSGRASMDRPIRFRLLELTNASGAPSALKQQLALAGKHRLFETALAPEIIRYGVAPLVDIALSDDDLTIRRRATAYLATAAARGQNDVVVRVLLNRLALDVEAKQVPWHDGPLFLPQLDWQAEQAHAMVTRLLAWYLWCGQRGLPGEQLAIHANLNARQLSSAAGYPFQSSNSADDWLRTWGKIVGVEGVTRLLQEQGLEVEYRAVVNELAKAQPR